MVAELLAALSKAEDIAEPLLTDAEAQKYTKGAVERKAELAGILILSDSSDRADRLNAYFSKLCADAGTPTIGLGGDILVPATFVLAFGGFAAELIAEQALANQLIAKLAK